MDILASLNFVLSIIIGLLILVVLVVLHELGHAIVARRNGVVVEEFGIGFPPKAWAKKLKNGILFTVNWLPLGGFVRMRGEYDSAHHKGDYGAASYWTKTKILLAGVVINWLVAVVIFTGFAIVGLPKFTAVLKDQFAVAADTTEVREPVRVVQVVNNSPADKAGLQNGDELVRINGAPLESPEDVTRTTQTNKGKAVEIIYRRASVETTAKLTLRSDNKDGNGYLGIGTNQRIVRKSTWSAPITAVIVTTQLTGATIQGLGQMIGNLATGLIDKANTDSQVRQQGDQKIGEVAQNVSGPVGILGILFPSAREAGIDTLLLVTAIISLSLAVMNILPIPALDGGRWYLMTIFKLLKRPLTKQIEERTNTIGFLILMGLVVLVTITDIGKFGK